MTGKVEREILAVRARATFLRRSPSAEDAWDQAYELGVTIGRTDMLEEVSAWFNPTSDTRLEPESE